MFSQQGTVVQNDGVWLPGCRRDHLAQRVSCLTSGLFNEVVSNAKIFSFR
jgi:hypothetical protein